MKDQKNLLKIKRHDLSTNRSLRPHSAADEYLLETFISLDEKPKHLGIYYDRFGYLSCHLHSFDPTIIFTTKSQQKAIDLNLTENKLTSVQYADPLSSLNKKIDYAFIKAPKSQALLELFLQHAVENSTEDITIVIAFMTRHFSPKLIEISEKYFEEVKQSKAVKKSRLITLTKKKEVEKVNLIESIDYNNHSYKQYSGVFSAKHIDYATQYFLEHFELKPTDHKILDLASGNGVIAKEIQIKNPDATIHLIDDSYLAVESAKLNIQGKNIHHHFNNDLSSIEHGSLDLIVSNPPFHFEYEINIDIPIQLFKECYRCLKPNGSLQLVANKHLNYLTHLSPIFSKVDVIAENEKFIVYKCMKSNEQEMIL